MKLNVKYLMIGLVAISGLLPGKISWATAAWEGASIDHAQRVEQVTDPVNVRRAGATDVRERQGDGQDPVMQESKRHIDWDLPYEKPDNISWRQWCDLMAFSPFFAAVNLDGCAEYWLGL